MADNGDGARAGKAEEVPRRRLSGTTILTAALFAVAAGLGGIWFYGYAGTPPPVASPSQSLITAEPAYPPLASPSAAPQSPLPATHVATTRPAASPPSRPLATPKATTKATTPTATAWETVTVAGTRVLNPGESWSSDRLRFALGTDGNVTLTDRGNQVWETGTAGRGGIRVVMQGDGNLVLYDDASNTVWSTRTDGHAGAVLVLGADGSLRITYAGTTIWSA